MDKGCALKRTLSLPAVVSLGVNAIIGQGIFLLPGKAAALLGPASMYALVFSGFLCFLIALCFAEVGCRFEGTGGAYIYALAAFGDFVSFEIGWLTCCISVVSWAALANGLASVLAYFFPSIVVGVASSVFVCSVLAALTLVNLFGANEGVFISTLLSVAKVLVMGSFVAIGAGHMSWDNFEPVAPEGYAAFGETTMLLLYAFVGFETIGVAAGEMQDPMRSVPLAILICMCLVSLLYLCIMGVAFGTLPEIAGSANPVAEASARIVGPAGGTLIAVGIVTSVGGTNAAQAFVAPRRFFAMAERGHLPEIFTRVHAQSGAPQNAILLTWLLATSFALTGTFEELAVLSVVARLIQYICTCVAVPVLRRKDTTPHAGFRVPFGPLIPIAAVLLSFWLLYNSKPKQLISGAAALLVGVPLYYTTPRAQQARANTLL